MHGRHLNVCPGEETPPEANCSEVAGLTTNVDVTLAPSDANKAVALGSGAPVAATSSDGNGLHSLTFKARPGTSPRSTGDVGASLQGWALLQAQQSVPLQRAESISAVLRTTDTYDDSRTVQLTYQLRDKDGNPRTDVAGVKVVLIVDGHELDECSRPTTNALWHSCSQQVKANMFSHDTHASVDVELRRNDGDTIHVHKVEALGKVFIHRKPQWVGTLASQFQGATSFAALPLAPLLEGDEFEVSIYAHTGAYPLETFWVTLDYDPSVFGFISFSDPKLFNAIEMDWGVNTRPLRFKAVGVQGTTTQQDVQKADLLLVTVKLRVHIGTRAGAHTFKVHVKEFINPGSVMFLADVQGSVLDARDNAQVEGQLHVRTVAERGILSYVPSGQLANWAVLTGQTQEHKVFTVVATDSDQSYRNVETGAVVCSLIPPRPTVLLLNDCIVTLNSGHADTAYVPVTTMYGPFSASVPLTVYTPQTVAISAADSVLNRISANVAGCNVYQRTTVSTVADGLDVTLLVTYQVSDLAVLAIATTSSSHDLHDVLRGIAKGEGKVFLDGRDAQFASTVVSVTNEEVTATKLVSRLVTGARWDTAPPATLQGDFTASVELQHSLPVEGNTGRIFARVTWSDGESQDVSTGLVDGENALMVTSSTSSLEVVAPESIEQHWQARVAVGAKALCGDLLSVELLMCSQPVQDTVVPVRNARASQITASEVPRHEWWCR